LLLKTGWFATKHVTGYRFTKALTHISKLCTYFLS